MTEDELKTLPPEDAETEVEVVAEPPKPAAVKTASDDAAARMREQMKALEETAAAERSARLEADRRAQAREQDAIRARAEVATAEQQLVGNGIEAATREREMAKRELQRALEAGEWDKVSDAQEALSMAAARLVQLDHAKGAVPAVPAQAAMQGRVEQSQSSRPDPVEAFISTASPASQAWLRQHRDLVKLDPRGGVKMDSRVLSAHYQAEADGINPDTPEYFSFIESRINPVVSQDEPTARTSPPVQRQRSAQVAAPVSRDPPVGNGNGQTQTRRIQLTKEQVEAAHMFGDPKKTTREREIDYWNNLKSLESEGKLGQSRH